MNDPRLRWFPGLLLAVAVAPSAALAVDPNVNGRAGDLSLFLPGVDEDRQVRPVAEGPLHEAFLSPTRDLAPDHVAKSPPPPIVERPGVDAPGPRAQWIEGYWEWDPNRDDFTWVTGTWRNPPPGRFWVNGYWKRDADGWYRVPGFWSDRRTERIDYRAEGPPADRPEEEVGEAPGPDYFYVPGHYEPDGEGVVWKKGFWSKAQPGWAWVPAQWVHQAEGWNFQEGYWDRTLEDRGILFSPAVPVAGTEDDVLTYQPLAQISSASYGRLYGAFGRPTYYYDGYPGCYYDPYGRYYGYGQYGTIGLYTGYFDYPFGGLYGYPYLASNPYGYGYGVGGYGYGAGLGYGYPGYGFGGFGSIGLIASLLGSYGYFGTPYYANPYAGLPYYASSAYGYPFGYGLGYTGFGSYGFGSPFFGYAGIPFFGGFNRFQHHNNHHFNNHPYYPGGGSHHGWPGQGTGTAIPSNLAGSFRGGTRLTPRTTPGIGSTLGNRSVLGFLQGSGNPRTNLATISPRHRGNTPPLASVPFANPLNHQIRTALGSGPIGATGTPGFNAGHVAQTRHVAARPAFHQTGTNAAVNPSLYSRTPASEPPRRFTAPRRRLPHWDRHRLSVTTNRSSLV